MNSTKRTNIRRKKASKKAEPFDLKKIVHNKFLHVVLLLLVGAGSFVFIRMKTVEVRYKVSEVQKELNKIEEENKILKAKKASLLAPKRMRKLANEFNLHEPKEKQVISIK